MTSLRLPNLAFMQSPIVQVELQHQRRITRARRWRVLLGRAGLLAGLMLALILYGGEFAGALLERDPTPIGAWFGVAVVLLLTFTGAWHFLLLFRVLSLAGNSIAREKQNGTWDLLVLTGIDARQIVLGKWWATVQRMLPAYLALAALRAGVIVWMAGSGSRALLFTVYANFGAYTPPELLVPSPLDILAAGLFVAALTLVNLAFTAACGVLASAGARSGVGALVGALFLRLGVLVVGSVVLTTLSILLGALLMNNTLRDRFFGGMLSRASITLMDNGVTIGSDLAAYQAYYVFEFVPLQANSYAGAVIALGLYALLTVLLLALAEWRTQAARALPATRAGAGHPSAGP